MGHQGEVPHEDLLFLDLPGFLVPQADLDLQGGGVGSVPGLALLHVVLGSLVHLVVDEGQLQVALIVRDRAHIGKDLPQAGVQKPVVRRLLNLQKVRHGHDFLMPGKVLAQGLSVVLVFGHLLKFTFLPLRPVRRRALFLLKKRQIAIRTDELLKTAHSALALSWEMCYAECRDKDGFLSLSST